MDTECKPVITGNELRWFDLNGNLVHYKDSNTGYEYYQEFDSNNCLTYFKDSMGCERKLKNC